MNLMMWKIWAGQAGPWLEQTSQKLAKLSQNLSKKVSPSDPQAAELADRPNFHKSSLLGKLRVPICTDSASRHCCYSKHTHNIYIYIYIYIYMQYHVVWNLTNDLWITHFWLQNSAQWEAGVKSLWISSSLSGRPLLQRPLNRGTKWMEWLANSNFETRNLNKWIWGNSG